MDIPFDEKKAADLEGTTVIDSELSTPVPGINRTWSSGSYPRLSEFMGLWPEVAIFRRFGALNAQNLLFLQAEIAHLERELKNIRERDDRREDERGLLAQRSWFELSQATEDGEMCSQWAIIQEIRSKLSEYSKMMSSVKANCRTHVPCRRLSLAIQTDMCPPWAFKARRQLPPRVAFSTRMWRQLPGRSSKSTVRISIHVSELFQERDILHPRDERHTENRRASDLVTLSREAVERDFFSQWISDEVLGSFHKLIGHRVKVCA